MLTRWGVPFSATAAHFRKQLPRECRPRSPASPAAPPTLPFPPQRPTPHLSHGPTFDSWARFTAQQQPGSAWVCSVPGPRWAPGQLAAALPHAPGGSAPQSPGGRLGLGTPAHSLSLPLPPALGFQTESKMGPHQVRLVFSQGNFPFIDSLLSGGPVLLPLSRFFLGTWG